MRIRVIYALAITPFSSAAPAPAPAPEPASFLSGHDLFTYLTIAGTAFGLHRSSKNKNAELQKQVEELQAKKQNKKKAAAAEEQVKKLKGRVGKVESVLQTDGKSTNDHLERIHSTLHGDKGVLSELAEHKAAIERLLGGGGTHAHRG
jgi:hypothetical protein